MFFEHFFKRFSKTFPACAFQSFKKSNEIRYDSQYVYTLCNDFQHNDAQYDDTQYNEAMKPIHDQQ
jgi:hypothetical protein